MSKIKNVSLSKLKQLLFNSYLALAVKFRTQEGMAFHHRTEPSAQGCNLCYSSPVGRNTARNVVDNNSTA